MDNDQLRDIAGTAQPFGQALEARDFVSSMLSDGWLEEHVRLQGTD